MSQMTKGDHRANRWRFDRTAEPPRPPGPQLPPRRAAQEWPAAFFTSPPPARHFMLKMRRDGPLVPARLRWLDHEPGSPDNKLDRGRLSVFPCADIGGMEVNPERLLDRLGVWQRRGDRSMLPHEVLAALADPAQQTPRPVGHWAYASPISEGEYEWRMKHLRWSERNRPDDPALAPRRAIDPLQLPLPDFTAEHERLGAQPAPDTAT